MHSQTLSISLLFIGGGLGTLGRYGAGLLIKSVGAAAHGFPTPTLAVNVLGCFFIGVLWQALAGPWAVREEFRVALLVGLLGGFTTFSSFGLESIQLWIQGHQGRAIAYVLLSNLLGFGGVLLGLALVGSRGSRA